MARSRGVSVLIASAFQVSVKAKPRGPSGSSALPDLRQGNLGFGRPKLVTLGDRKILKLRDIGINNCDREQPIPVCLFVVMPTVRQEESIPSAGCDLLRMSLWLRAASMIPVHY